MKLEFRITNQTLTCTRQLKLVSKSVNFVTAVFTFNDVWDDL